MEKKSGASLKSIAARAGVSTTTVHRALTGKKDCSDEMRERILQIAREEGYEINYMAASLRMKTSRIAIIAPARHETSRLFVDKIVAGIEKCRARNSGLRIDYRYFYYDSKKDEVPHILSQIASGKAGEIDAVLTHLLSLSPKGYENMSRIIESGRPVVFLDNRPAGGSRTTVIGTDNIVAGRIAGELIAKMVHGSGQVVILSQKMGLSDANAEEAKREIEARRPDLKVAEHPLELDDQKGNLQIIKGILENRPIAIYTTCARHTLCAIRAMGMTKRVGVFVGSELFEESLEAIESGVVDAIIDKKPDDIGYKGLEVLIDHLVKKEALEREYLVEPFLVLKANAQMRYRESLEHTIQ